MKAHLRHGHRRLKSGIPPTSDWSYWNILAPPLAVSVHGASLSISKVALSCKPNRTFFFNAEIDTLTGTHVGFLNWEQQLKAHRPGQAETVKRFCSQLSLRLSRYGSVGTQPNRLLKILAATFPPTASSGGKRFAVVVRKHDQLIRASTTQISRLLSLLSFLLASSPQ